MPLPTDSLFLAASREIVDHFGAGERPAKITITTATGLKMRMDVPPTCIVQAPQAPTAFVPSSVQKVILKALEGRALRTSGLTAAAGGDKRRLFRDPGGVQELVRQGLVKRHERLGYYNPKALPPELNNDGQVKRWVYFVQMGEKGPIKIGSANNVKKRLATLQTSSPETLRLLGAMPNKRCLENLTHQKFAAHRIKGEWFKPHKEILDYISENCSALPSD